MLNEYIFKDVSIIKIRSERQQVQTHRLVRKYLVFGILLSFVGTSFILNVSHIAFADIPLIFDEHPANASAHVSVYLSEISFTISDPTSENIEYIVTTSPDFIGGPHSGTVSAGTTVHILRRNGMLTNDTTYVWRVNVTDGMDWISQTYSFTTVSEIFEGYTLFTPIKASDNSTYLIDADGNVVHSWPTNYSANLGVYMVENGNILRPCILNDPEKTTAIQKINWNGTVIWEYYYFGQDYWQSHDIAPLPNGNVLILALERKTAADAIAAGRNPALLLDNELWPAYVVEVEPTGPTSGDIVWEWHLWDHLIQDFNPTKANYGVVQNHPELLDINFAIDGHNDWIHPNTIHYNPELDQVIISSRYLGEFWIIDHSTTTEEAAMHTGGIHGRGGDFLYRWGNPQSYRAGNASDQKLFGPHDPQWIAPGCPGEGDILIFNNGWRRPEGPYSTVDEITPPIDASGNYSLLPGAAFGPENLTWQYKAVDPYSFNGSFISGCERLPNGNTLICSGPSGVFFEVTMGKEIVWSYNNTHPSPGSSVFRVRRYYSPFCPPIAPSITGPTNGTVGVPYNYTFATTDPDGGNVYYCIDWGDSTPLEWIGPYESGEEITVNHSWVAENDYLIRCEAKDTYDSMSTWSTMTVNVRSLPYQPSSPIPTDGATGVDINADVSWTGGDPDTGDTITYDVYFGRDNPPLKRINNQTNTSFDPGVLEYGRIYFWRIVAWDSHGRSTAGLIWNFTTVFDITAPVTICSLYGTLGNQSWFQSPVAVTLTTNETQSGVNYTLYKVDDDAWTFYNGPFVIVGDDQHTILYYSVDRVGNVEDTKLSTLKIDTTTPISYHFLSGFWGKNGWYTSNVTIFLTANDIGSGVNHTYYKIDNENWVTYATPFIFSSEGSHTLGYFSIDNAGNTETIKGPFVFNIDRTKPITTHTFSGTTGSNGWYISNVTITLSATDTVSGVDHTYYQLDGGKWKTYFSPLVISIEDTHTLKYFSVDNSGNIESMKGPFTFKIDETTPVTTHQLSGTMGNNNWYISSVTITLTATDPSRPRQISPVKSTNGRGPSGINTTYYKIDTGSWTNYTVPFSVSTDGCHNLSYYSVDYAGNTEPVTGPFAFKIDQTPPRINLTVTALNPLKTKWLLAADVNDVTSGVSKVEFYIDNVLQGTITTPGPYQWIYEGSGKIAKAVVYDAAGNAKTSDEVTVDELSSKSMSTPRLLNRKISRQGKCR